MGRHCGRAMKMVAHKVAMDVTLTLLELVEMEIYRRDNIDRFGVSISSQSSGSDKSSSLASSLIEHGAGSLCFKNTNIWIGHSHIGRSRDLRNQDVVSATQESTRIVETPRSLNG